MLKSDIIDFFNKLAPQWDADMIRNDGIINTILDNAEVKYGSTVLDVACGTGVLFPDYLKRDVKKLVGIDISPIMTDIAVGKFDGNQKVCVITGDAETVAFEDKFDCIVIYNAFPHFPDPENLIRHLTSLLALNGTLTVAHGMSRKMLDNHHSKTASKVSVGLPSESELSALFSKYLDVYTTISDDKMYQVAGRKKKV